jgi:hypothetical protein
LKEAIDSVKIAERANDKEAQAEKARVLILGEKIKAPNAAMDWERDTNTAVSAEQTEVNPSKPSPSF